MPSDSMIDRVALALCRARNEDPAGMETTFWQDGPQTSTFLECARHDAVHVLRAMREPTDAMRAAVLCYDDRFSEPLDAWRAMIDAALEEAKAHAR